MSRKPVWEKLDEESEIAYSAFARFRDLNLDRSIVKAYRLQTGREVQSAPGYWNRWSKKYRWNQRTLAYDNHRMRIEQKKRDEELLLRVSEEVRQQFKSRDQAVIESG